MVDSSNFMFIKPNCSGCWHNKWKAYCVDGHCPFKNVILLVASACMEIFIGNILAAFVSGIHHRANLAATYVADSRSVIYKERSSASYVNPQT